MRRKGHAQRFVKHYTCKPLDRRLEDVRAGRAAQRQRNFFAFDTHGDFVLCASQRKANAFLAREQRPLRQLSEDSGQFLRVKLPVVVIALGQLLPCEKERNRSRTFAADLFKHGVVVVRADTQIAGDDFPFALFRQNAAEKSSAFLRRETLLPQWQGLRQGCRTWFYKPVFEIFKRHLAAVVLDE